MKNITYINAGAGSGKTYTLTQELVKLIKSGISPEQVILTTFTTKAASEFKEKAKAALYKEGLFDSAAHLDQAMIGTVHSVCQRMIGKYWFNLGLSPSMNVMAEEDTQFYLSQSLADLPTEQELALLHNLCRSFDVRKYENSKPLSLDYDFWQLHLKQIIEFTTSYEIADYARSEKESLDFIRQFVTEGCTAWVEDSELSDMLREARLFVETSNRIKKKEEYFQKINEVELASRKRDVLFYKLVLKHLISKYGPVCAAVIDRLQDIWHSQEIYDQQEQYIHLIFNLAQRWRDNFARFKQEKNLLDYNDMEKYMRQLMQDKEISSEISKSYRYLFVDEFQDSSPIQVKIFDALSDLMEHCYWVGDYKQAIYRFRGTDIELVKAVVDRITSKCDGCDTYTLGKSYRSLPDIVGITNDIFTTTFDGVLRKENVQLDVNRKNEEGIDSLRYFCGDGPEGVAEHVAKLISEGAKPEDIAVLSRSNLPLSKIAESLNNDYGITSTIEASTITETFTYLVFVSLLRIVSSSRDTLAKATVAKLTEPDYDTRRIIEEKLINDAKDDGTQETYLDNVTLVRRVMQLRPTLLQQSISSMIESLVIELNIFNVLKCADEPKNIESTLQTIINTARVYEEHCAQMNLPTSIEGFISYVDEMKPTGLASTEGVILTTYHSSKGLEWKYVILTSLNSDPGNEHKVVASEIFGVHCDHSVEPSADNPYPEVFIRIMPWIYGPNGSIPTDIELTILQSDAYKRTYKASLEEANRIMYVGMTRARDVLLLQIEEPKKTALLQWFIDLGITNVCGKSDTPDGWDIFCTGRLFKDYTITEQEILHLPKFEPSDDTKKMALPLSSPADEERPGCYLSPSKMHTKGTVVDSHSFNTRIPLGAKVEDMAVVGDCIHQIFAGIEETDAQERDLSEIINSYGLSKVLVEQKSIKEAWKNLTDWLTTQYGPALKTYHERPFRLETDGQIVTGSMDLVWQTEQGLILVDFKTCPAGGSVVLNEESAHYAGWYAGQLNCYTQALTTAGETVLHRLIYYPVSGIIAVVK